MPLATAVPSLANFLLPLYDPGKESTVEAAQVWADAYFKYTLQGNVIPVPARKTILAADLTQAFNPELAGAGRGLFLTALAKYWLGTPATVPPGTVAIFIPSGSIDSDVAVDSTALEQAQALADLVHQLTIKSAKVVPTAPGPAVPVT